MGSVNQLLFRLFLLWWIIEQTASSISAMSSRFVVTISRTFLPKTSSFWGFFFPKCDGLPKSTSAKLAKALFGQFFFSLKCDDDINSETNNIDGFIRVRISDSHILSLTLARVAKHIERSRFWSGWWFWPLENENNEKINEDSRLMTVKFPRPPLNNFCSKFLCDFANFLAHCLCFIYIPQVLNSSSTTTSRVAKKMSSQRLQHITASSSTSSQSSQSQLSTTTSGNVVNPHALQRDLNEFKNSMSEINNLAARSNQMAELQKR